MGKAIVQTRTTIDPISLIGEEAGCCWGAPVDDPVKNYKRGMDCLKANHGRTMEFPQVYLILDGYSARVIREFYTHIAGGPTRLQASTRYIDYEHGFDFIFPPSIANNDVATNVYVNAMDEIADALQKLDEMGIPREDSANLLPLGMTTKVVVRTNLRNLIDMSHQRLCSRAYWEFRQLMKDIMNALKDYSEEWTYIIDNYFQPKCEVCGFCTETKSCGRKPSKETHEAVFKLGTNFDVFVPKENIENTNLQLDKDNFKKLI